MIVRIQQLAVKTLAFLISVGAVSAQQPNPPPPGGSWNPYLIQGIVSPAPMLPVEFNGTGSLIFDVGNTGSSDIVWVTGQEMLLTISLSYGLPNVANPSNPAQAITAVTGPGSEWFSWEYFPAQNTFRGTQKATIPGNSRKTIQIAYKVTKNSFINESYQNGYNVNVSPPGYTNPQTTDDDSVASYTYVQAFDYGDAPLSYSPLALNPEPTPPLPPSVSGRHEIDLSRQDILDESDPPQIIGTAYNRYIYLGTKVDPESASQSNATAMGDDSNQSGGLNSDDEDGVVIPALTPGQSASITYTVGVVDEDYFSNVLRFSGWIDWNKDGDFLDTGERIANNASVASSGTYQLNITVPANAVNGATFARFRIGPQIGTLSSASPTANAAYGEVEDYIVSVGTTAGTVTGRIYGDINGNGLKDSAESYSPNVSVTVTDASNNPQSVATDANGFWSAFVPTGSATVDINNADPDLPPSAVLTQGNDPRGVTILTHQNADGGIAGFAPSGYPAWRLNNNTTGPMDQDHDQDGVSNGIEYFLVGPYTNSAGLNGLPSIQKQGDVMSITWTKASNYTGSYTTHFVVETSTNLQTPWTPQPLGTNVTINGNQIIYTFPKPYLNRQFVRLRVSGP